MKNRSAYSPTGPSYLAICLLAVLVAMSGCSGLSRKPVWQPIGPDVDELAAFDQTIKEFMVEHKVPCAGLAVTCRGRLVLARGYNWSSITRQPVGPESLFRIASLSKSITAVAVMRLAEQGGLSLDDRLVDLLDISPPPGRPSDPRLRQITVRHLLQHLGGWDRDKAFDPMFQDERIARELNVSLPIRTEHIIRFMAGQPLQHDPGTTMSYSNFGYCLLGRIIEKRTGLSYGDYVRTELLAPLGITRTRLGHSNFEDRAADEVEYQTDSGSAYGAFNVENMDSHGGWIASAVDLARFAAAFDNPDNCPILSRASIEAMFALPPNIDPNAYKTGDVYYACGWNVRDFGSGKRNTWHTGSLPGTYTFMARWAGGVNCVVLFNKRGPGFAEIDKQLGAAAHSVKHWPSHDLFAALLSLAADPNAPADPTRRQ